MLVCWPNELIEQPVADLIGRKALGLLSLPSQWVPPFFMLPATLHSRWQSGSANGDISLDLAEQQSLEKAIEALVNRGASKLFVRSSADCESLQIRGQFSSFTVEPNISSVLAGIKLLYQNAAELPDTNVRLGVVVQECIESVRCIGHLSNERRLSPELDCWFCEIEASDQTILNGIIPVIPDKGAHNSRACLHLGHRLDCTSEIELKSLWAALADWTISKDQRVHFEWIWDGAVLWLVQADQEQVFHDLGPRAAGTPLPESGPVGTLDVIAATRLLRPAMELPIGLSHKADWLSIFGEQELPVAQIWAWHARYEDARAIADGRFPESLRAELHALTSVPTVIRTDLPSTVSAENRLFLPHSNIVRSGSQAESFLRNVCQSLFERKLLGSGVIFLAHHYVPALAAALCEATPGGELVLIESIWGLPDGLQHSAHDSFRVRADGYGEISRRVRYKDVIVDVKSDGSWGIRQLGEPWDWKPSLTDDEIRTIARGSSKVSKSVGLPLQIMWFAGVRDAKQTGCLPWHALQSDKPSAHFDHGSSRELRTRCNRIRITSREDLGEAARSLGDSNKESLIELQPEMMLLRSKDFLAKVAHLANEFRVPVILHGSVLSHAYYILRRAGVVVLPHDEHDWLVGR